MDKRWTALGLSVLLLAGCAMEPAPSQAGGKFQPGRYQGTGEGYGGTVTVEVEVSADRIEAVTVLSHNESRGVCEAAFEQIPAEILRQGTPYVELVAGATLTSQAVVDAAAAALSQAGGEFTPPEPEPEVRTQRELYAGLVIAGAGGSGMTAAAEAVRQGGATVLVLEQQDIIGGETLYEAVLTLPDDSLTSGYGLLGDLRAEVDEAGAELLTGVKLTGLEVTDGRVTGVRAESADTDYRIHAEYGVILATGDYGGSPDLVLEYAGETGLAQGLEKHFRTLSRGSSDGSGLMAARETGAAAAGLGQLELWDCAPEQRRLGESRTLLCVDSTGRRLTVPEEDSAWIARLLELPEGAFWAVGPADRLAEETARPSGASGEARLVTGESLEELAEAMGADPDRLRQAVEAYNAAVPAEDALGDGPWAAEWRTPVLAETPGGIRTNSRGEVLREDGSVLAGLYAVGTAAAGVEDDGTLLFSETERAMEFPGRAVRAALGLPETADQPDPPAGAEPPAA